ncbi:nuclear transport factor 2 family protein [Mucilaginibacter sp. RB4R14]|uniref:nuclear transport factor 2 family protein n=1 Tax=Mucilaginibacter aurantiaciroseus TaxID=2949308 RepID=UPI0020905A87|nr:nuclear transport factor 2 family protein [Mucilaginibacter aurantiaciroseus]MCO5937082.1 nuclear transport factor 2 family protein [Mucilaginibacter aurantiaciroseus]
MKKLFLATLLIASTTSSFCQTDKDDIKKIITNMFDGMRKGDTIILRSTFHKDMVLQSVANKKDGSTTLVTEKADDFIKQVGTLHKEIYDERITWGDIKIDGDLASVWTPYKFYVGSQFSHCGVDFYQLMKTATGWKVIYIVDTRRKDNCPE